MENIRAFIAIELPREIRDYLSRLQSPFKKQFNSQVKWANPQSIHLTLSFLGNISAESTGHIEAAMHTATANIKPFVLEITGTGVFPNPSRTRIVWAGVGGDTGELKRLQHAVEQSLVPHGFIAEKRGFSPHLTLGRVRETATTEERRALGAHAISLQVEGKHVFPVRALSLMRSRLEPTGAVYSRIASVELR